MYIRRYLYLPTNYPRGRRNLKAFENSGWNVWISNKVECMSMDI